MQPSYPKPNALVKHQTTLNHVIHHPDCRSGSEPAGCYNLEIGGRVSALEFIKKQGGAGCHSPGLEFPAFADYGSITTGVPTMTRRKRYSAFQLAKRKQPCDSVRPTSSGRGVPWMP